MKWSDIAAFLVSHAVAGATYLMVFLVVPAILGVIAVGVLLVGCLATGDLGGPLFLPALFILGVVYAGCMVALGVFLFLLTGALQGLRRHIAVPAWLPVVLAFPVVFTILYTTRTGGVLPSLALTAAFLTYWLAFSGSDAVLAWMRRKWRKRKGQRSEVGGPRSNKHAAAVPALPASLLSSSLVGPGELWSPPPNSTLPLGPGK